MTSPRSAPVASTLPTARVGVAEDEALIAEELRQQLTQLGLTVVGVVDSADDVVALVARELPDLMLMDIQLKGHRDGIETAREIRERFDVPVIFLTAHSDDETVRRAKETWPLGFLIKPFTARDLRVTIEVALHRHAMEQKLRASERHWATTLTSIGDAVIATDTEGRVSFLNPVAEALTRWTLEDARGEPLERVFRIVDAATRKAAESPVARALRDDRIVTFGEEMLLLTKDGGEVAIDDSAAPIRDENRRPVGGVLIFRDVSEKKRAAEALTKSEEQLRQAQTMEAIGRLAGGVAHDVNNMMTVVLGCADLLLEGMDAGDGRRALVEEVRQAAERSAAMTQQLLAFGRRQILRPEAINLAHVIWRASEMLRRLIGTEVTLHAEIPLALGAVFVDRRQIERVLMNLVANALEAMPEGGRIRIEAKNLTVEESAVSGEVRPGHYVLLSVSDTGAGMDEETRAHVFEPFFTTKEAGKASGLGLATVYGIVTQSGGYVFVESELGRGTTFSIYIPRIDGMPPPVPPA